MMKSIQIRRAVERLEERGRGVRYPAELKAKLISETRSLRAAGVTLEASGEKLGVPWRTLARWCSAERKAKPRFRQVEVLTTPRSTPTVYGPRGIRIEGLDVGGVAELVVRLG